MQIYLSGAMKDATVEQQTETRQQIFNYFKDDDIVEVFNPYAYFNYQHEYHKSEKEVMKFELRKLMESSLLIYEEQGIKSIGSAMEIAIAYHYNMPVLVFNKDHHELHPWIEEMSDRVFDNFEEMLEYISWYYL